MQMKAILGSMTFGEQADRDTAASMLKMFVGAGYDEVDTAHTYVDGKTEALLGELIDDQQRQSIRIATKVNPWNDDGLKPAQVHQQFEQSLERLQTDAVDLLYLHAPDLDTPIADTLRACHELHQQGRFREFGLSNYASWQVAEIAELCRHHGWMPPTVYQGLYNALTRGVEPELFPCLRNYGIRFYAYNPLAGGLLSGKYTSIDALPEDGRFGIRTNYRERYWKQDYFSVLEAFSAACADAGIEPAAAALRWLAHHSQLDATKGDGVILGASRIEQLEENLAAMEQPPLDDAIVEVLDRGWEVTRPDSFRYFRP